MASLDDEMREIREKAAKYNQWSEELHAAIETLDVSIFRKFYKKWTEAGIYENGIGERLDDEVWEISIRKMAVNLPRISPETKAKAEAWLTERGYDLKMD